MDARDSGVAELANHGHCVAQLYNLVMPHSALEWRTPDEVYFGQEEDVSSKLATARQAAREARMAINRATSCEACTWSVSSLTALDEAA